MSRWFHSGAALWNRNAKLVLRLFRIKVPQPFGTMEPTNNTLCYRYALHSDNFSDKKRGESLR